MTFEIHNHKGAGPIRFGMSPTAVRKALNAEFESFKRTPQSVHPCDYFSELQCFVYYDVNGRAEATEFAKPAEPMLEGVNLLGISFADLVQRITGQDPDIAIEDDGFTSINLGIGCHAPSAKDEPEAPPESVIVFMRGYYT